MEEVVADADASGGGGFAAEADGDARLSRAEFGHVVSQSAVKPLARARLGSIGRLLKEVRLAEEEVEADREFERDVSQPSAAYAEAHERAHARRMHRIEELSRDAFPFAIVANAHRITRLVQATTTHQARTSAARAHRRSRSRSGSPRSPNRGARRAGSPPTSPSSPPRISPTSMQKAAARALWRFKTKHAAFTG